MKKWIAFFSQTGTEIIDIAETLIKELPGKYNYRVIGFTIILMKRSNKIK